jgi:hypothetical protein
MHALQVPEDNPFDRLCDLRQGVPATSWAARMVVAAAATKDTVLGAGEDGMDVEVVEIDCAAGTASQEVR